MLSTHNNSAIESSTVGMDETMAGGPNQPRFQEVCNYVSFKEV
jgi:hypothetical protein